MQELYELGINYFNKKDFVEALRCFSQIDYLDSKKYENDCIDLLEDLIYYSKRKQALLYLESLAFYKDYSFFVDAYKRRRTNLISKILMFGSALIGTIILIILSLM